MILPPTCILPLSHQFPCLLLTALVAPQLLARAREDLLPALLASNLVLPLYSIIYPCNQVINGSQFLSLLVWKPPILPCYKQNRVQRAFTIWSPVSSHQYHSPYGVLPLLPCPCTLGTGFPAAPKQAVLSYVSLPCSCWSRAASHLVYQENSTHHSRSSSNVTSSVETISPTPTPKPSLL